MFVPHIKAVIVLLYISDFDHQRNHFLLFFHFITFNLELMKYVYLLKFSNLNYDYWQDLMAKNLKLSHLFYHCSGFMKFAANISKNSSLFNLKYLVYLMFYSNFPFESCQSELSRVFGHSIIIFLLWIVQTLSFLLIVHFTTVIIIEYR